MDKKLIILLSSLLVIVLCGVFGILPTNAAGILAPLDGVLNFLSVGLFVIALGLAFCRKRIGKEELKVDNFSFFSMIFTCGTGVGLLSWAFLEPFQFATYPDCRGPLGLAISHWTLVPWGIFAAFAVFESLDDEYKLIKGKLADIKNLIYSIVMIIGIATTYAIGVNALTGVVFDLYGFVIPTYAWLIVFTALTAISVLLGIQKGLKNFSNTVLVGYFVFLAVLIGLHPSGILAATKTGAVEFCRDFLYNHHYRGTALQQEWTVFYWIWFTSWVPFTCRFIAQISKGRRISTIILCTLVLPCVLTVIHQIAGYNLACTLPSVDASTVTSMILSKNVILGILYVFLMIGFFITSADSMTLALDDSMKVKSKYSKPARKIFWVGLVMFFTTILMLIGSGSIKVIQGLSFLITPLIYVVGVYYVIVIVYRLIKYKSLKVEDHEEA